MGASKTKVGLVYIGCQRFRELGKDCASGSYVERRERFVQGVVRELSAIADCVYPGTVYLPEDADAAIATFAREKVQCVVATFLSWSEDFTWSYLLRKLSADIPLVYYLPVMGRVPYADTRDENDFVEFLAQGGLVGSLIGSASWARQKRQIEIFVDDFATVRPRLEAFFAAARAKDKLRRAHYGLVPGFNEIMRGTFIDPYAIFTKIGPKLDFFSYDKLHKLIMEISDAEAQKYVDELSAAYPVEPGISPKLFLESARASLGLAALRNEQNLDALILNDVSGEIFETLGLRPGFYPEDFDRNDAILTPEGDLGAATAMYLLRQVSGGKHVNYVEPFYIEKETGSFAAGHAGPHDYTDPRFRDHVRISIDARFAKTKYRYAGAPFAWYRIPEGLKTIAHLSQGPDERYKLVCFKAESLPGPHKLCGYCHSDFKVVGDAGRLFEEILKVGVTQHFAAVEGDVTNELKYVAELCDFDFHCF